ncbi:MAG: ribosome biogenesis GTPase Der [Vicinamibacteria bacterium]
MPLPTLALVGRPNVGKSTLFNRICGRRKAITDNRPGSTRDRNYAQASWLGAAFELVDTGGLLLGSVDPLLGPAQAQAQRAIEQADLVLMLVDARAGLLPDDEQIARDLRHRGKQVILVANKDDTGRADVGEFTRLGWGQPVVISAEHGQGVGDLLDAAVAKLPRAEVPEQAPPGLRLALVGRPNTGKSSLLNRLVGDERALVSEIAGTTRDAVDCLIERGAERYLIVDTAGIRKGRLLKENVDHVSVVQARHSIERADVVVLVLDAEAGVREMDATIAGLADKAGRGVVIAVNKWDLAAERGLKQRSFTEGVRDDIKFLSWAPLVFVSARTGMGVAALLKKADAVGASCRQRVTTGQVNRVLGKAAREHAPKAAKGGAPVSILYGAQVGIAPPTFAVSISHPVDLHFSYKRFLENRIRAAFGFEGAPVVIKVRARRH